ncbi:MAG: hypothetical protein RMK89_04010 [Armatimonadota bacterium]|nr:hypothetical protein [Armatimonadota bacterium]MDW8142610.1 hypothetical protein [Armatimonadota bacterium]
MGKARLLSWVVGLLLWGLLRGLLPLLPIPFSLLPIAWALTLVGGVALLLWLALEVGKVVPSRLAVISGLVIAGFRVALTFLTVPKDFSWQIAFGSVADTLTLTSALLLGSAISGLVRHANLLLPVAIVLTVVDIWTVWFGGFVAQVYQRAQEGVAVAQKVVEAATVKMPTVATAHYARIGIPVIGLGDLFFAAFLFAILWRFGLNTRHAFILSIVFVVVGLLIAQLPFVPFGIPGLPFIVLAILLPNLRAFQYTPEEKKALLIGGVFLFALLAVFSIMVGRM